MKTRRNIRRKGRRTYKTRKYGGGKDNKVNPEGVGKFKNKKFNPNFFIYMNKKIKEEQEDKRIKQEIEKEKRNKIEKEERNKKEKEKEERNKIEKEEEERIKKEERNKKEKEERIKKERDESGINNSVMTSEEIYNTQIIQNPKIKDNFIQFLAKLNDTQRKEIEDNKYGNNITDILTHYIQLKYKLKKFSTYYNKNNPNHYDDLTYIDYQSDIYNTHSRHHGFG